MCLNPLIAVIYLGAIGDIEEGKAFLQGAAELVFKGEFSPLNWGL